MVVVGGGEERLRVVVDQIVVVNIVGQLLKCIVCFVLNLFSRAFSSTWDL